MTDYSWNYGERFELRKPHRINRRKRVRHALPAVALVFADPHAARGRAHRQALSRPVNRQAVAEDEVIGVFLRQAFFQALESLAAVPRARHHQGAINRNALLVLDAGHEPGRVRVIGVNRHAKAEGRRLGLHLGPALRVVHRFENAAVMLHPELVGLCAALHHHVRILRMGIARLFRWPLVKLHAMRRLRPGGAAVMGDPHAAAGNGHPHGFR